MGVNGPNPGCALVEVCRLWMRLPASDDFAAWGLTSPTFGRLGGPFWACALGAPARRSYVACSKVPQLTPRNLKHAPFQGHAGCMQVGSAAAIQPQPQPQPLVPPVPANTVLLHVGARKTATTAIQSAFAAGRQTAMEHGVLYPGTGASDLKNIPNLYSPNEKKRCLEQWSPLQAEVADWQGRVFLSSENLESATAEQAREMVSALGAERVRVLITARRLSAALPSLWQQKVKRKRVTQTLEAWATERLNNQDHPIWHGQRIDHLAHRWGQIVGPRNVYILPIDLSHPSNTIPSVENLLNIPPGTLHAERSNRGLSLEEAELLRQRNMLIQTGAIPAGNRKEFSARFRREIRARSPRPQERKPKLPQWSVTQIEHLQRQIVDGLNHSDFQILGEISQWNAPRLTDFTDDQKELIDLRDGPDMVPTDAVAALLRAHSATAYPPSVAQPSSAVAAQAALKSVSARRLLGELTRRIKRKPAS